jgi:two-component system cell cycle response regulator DivK
LPPESPMTGLGRGQFLGQPHAAVEIRSGFPGRRALESHAWTLDVTDARHRASAAEPRHDQPEDARMAKTVLIVEDNELNMKLFHDLLEAHGYDTLGTRNGIEALNLARQHHPDLIVMDIQLPEVSGLEVTKWLKDDPELKAIPVVAVTAFAMKGDEERIREGGCEAYLSKPISVGKFLETVRHFLGTA